MEILSYKSKRDRVRGVKKLMLSVGNSFGAVTFKKRSDGKIRKMSYRLHVTNPQYAKKPESKIHYRKTIEEEKDLLTVFDTNTLRYNKKGMLNGRRNYKCVPLDGVIRLKVNGVIYKIVS